VSDETAPSQAHTESHRPLTLVAAVALVVANMVGVGIFTSTGYQSASLGGAAPALAAWIVGGVIALCGAAVYGELGAMMPRAGGEYVYLSRAFRPWVGFLSGWISLIVGFSAPIAAAAYAFGFYVHLVAPEIPLRVAGVGLIVATTAMHMGSVAFGAKLQTLFSLLKVALILVLIVAGVAVGQGDWAHLGQGAGLDTVARFRHAIDGVLSAQASGGSASLTDAETFAVSLVYVMFAYSGWNAAAYVAGEIKNPGRNVPRALFIGTAIVMALYLCLNLVFFYAAPASELASADLSLGSVAMLAADGKPHLFGGPVREVCGYVAMLLFGPGFGTGISALIAFALISSVSAMVMAGPRVYMAMAEDGLFFRVFAKKSTRGAPVFSVLLQGGLAIALFLFAKFDQLLNYVGFTLSISAALTIAGAFVLRRKHPDAPRPYKTFGWPVTPILFIAVSAWMAFFLVRQRPTESLAGIGTLAVGTALFFVWKRFAASDE
jgi:APA family basic amino acid/polyamine antiporter